MHNLLRTCFQHAVKSSSLVQKSSQLANQRVQHIELCRTIFTSPTLQSTTKKRRKKHPFFWLQDQYRKYFDEKLTPENERFFQKFLQEKYPLNNTQSPLKKEPWDRNEKFTEGTARTGLLARKIGVCPMWTKEGNRVMTTCLRISDNHVIKYHPPEVFAKNARPIDRVRYQGLGSIVIGADSEDPRRFTAEYNGLFEESGVMPKKKLTRFLITHNARIEPGTLLLASHFRPGMYVDIYGKSRWLGLVSLRRRFQLKLGRKTHGATKNHNRIGSIGRGRKHAGPLKGKRMPGTHGNERVILPGIKVMRVNTKYNLIYVLNRGVPGEVGNYVNIMDSRIEPKKLKVGDNVPFPTVTQEENARLPEDMYDESLHIPSEPSIIFEVTEEEKKAAALAAMRRKGSAKTAQKIR